MNSVWLETAMEIAIKAHKGQKDKAGEPYILHPLHVMMKCRHNEDIRIVAILHDVIEDGGEEYRDYIKNTGFKQEILDALDCLTHKKGEDYFDYIRRVKTNELAKEIKIRDLDHNMDLDRIPNPKKEDFIRRLKYAEAIEILLS